jgi:rhamnosyltransferase subunit B
MNRSGARILLTTFGSFGDLHPYIAVARVLQTRGHEVGIATSAAYKSKLEALGIPCHPLRPDMPSPDEQVEIVRRVFNQRSGPEYVIKWFMAELRDTYEDLAVAARGHDLLVSHPLTFATRLVAEKQKIVWASSLLAPIGLVSVYDPPVPPYAPHLAWLRILGPWFFRLGFAYVRRSFSPFAAPWHALRSELNLPPVHNPIFEGQHSPHLVLAMFSGALGEPQRDWPPNCVQTGFPFFDQDGEAELPNDLARFLDAGPEPIVFTLGSSAVMDAGAFYEESLKAAKLLDRRAVLLVGREARPLPPELLSENVSVCPYAPFSELFPRCAAIVHQGGVGTTGQALRAGRPMLVVPFGVDQPDNGVRACRQGVARMLHRSKYKAERVGVELKRLLGDPRYGAKAKQVGVRIQSEDGAAAAADALELLLRRSPSR